MGGDQQYDPLHNFNKGFGRVFTFKNIFIAVKRLDPKLLAEEKAAVDI